MPSYKDTKTGKWYCKFYYRDWTDKNRPKKKMGFKTKKESQEWERAFLDKQNANPDMTFRSLTEIYFEDMTSRLKKTTYMTKKYIFDYHLLPYFKDIKINEISAPMIRKWQNQFAEKELSQTYIRTIHNQLSAILNYAVKYYGLSGNPCHKSGNMGKAKADGIEFWTEKEFIIFLSFVTDIDHKIAYEVLYYTGMRIGELLALTQSDIDLELKTIKINKTYSRLMGDDLVTEPKTQKSNRLISIPNFLCEDIRVYASCLYDLQPDERIFGMYTRHHMADAMKKYIAAAGVKKIRLHDLRHSHASLLIELGFSPLLIAERLGHERVETTLNTYSHLYPHKQSEVCAKLDELRK